MTLADVLVAEPAKRLAAVQADLTYIVPQAAKPRFLSQAYTGGAHVFEFETEQHRVEITDLRPVADLFTLDHEGFAFRNHHSAVQDFYDDAQIEHIYSREIQEFVAREFGASSVYVFDVTRRSDAKTGAANKDGARGTASRIHVDYTAKSGPKRFRDVAGDAQADRILASGARVVQINVWRPIKGPVQSSPLALADASTVHGDDLIATDQVFPDRIGEIYHLAYNPGQRWYYAPAMEPHETFLIKGWDSLADGRAQFTPHTAFNQVDPDPNAAARESIEVRTYAVID